MTVAAGERLSERHDRDSYATRSRTSIGGATEDELTRKFEQAVAALPFEIDDPGADGTEPPA